MHHTISRTRPASAWPQRQRSRLDLDDTEKAALAELLRETIERDRFPLSPRIKSLRAILAKLELPKPAPEVFPPVKPPGEPSMTMRKRRRR